MNHESSAMQITVSILKNLSCQGSANKYTVNHESSAMQITVSRTKNLSCQVSSNK